MDNKLKNPGVISVNTKKRYKFILYPVLVVISFICFFPMLWMLFTSLMTDPQIMDQSIFPNPIEWKNWPSAVTTFPFLRYLWNTFFIAVLSTIGAMIVNPMAAYSLARVEWVGRNLLFTITIAVMFLPATVTMIPVYLEWKTVGLMGTPWPLILRHFFGASFFIFLLRQFFLALPTELEDAARVDGLGEYGIYFHIMLPLAMPGILTVGLFQFIQSWDDFMGPLIYLNDSKTYTLSLGISQFIQEHNVQTQEMMAVALFTVIPIIILYFFVQKRFIQGITFSGSKG